MSKLYYGVVEQRLDPLKLGRCQVRVMGIHTHDKIVLPTNKLPWAIAVQPINSAAMNGIGQAPVGVVPGTWVIVQFMDDSCQQPIMIGCVGGIPDTNTISAAKDDDAIVIRDSKSGIASEHIVVTNANGDVVKTVGAVKDEPVKPAKIVSGGSDTSLPTSTPPPNSVKNRSGASQGISAIISACLAAGYTERNAISAILGIIGGECGWIPTSESFTYTSVARLVEVFKVFKLHPEFAAQYVNNPSELPEFVYGYQSLKGPQLGNIDAGDGAKYIGRGFIQLTGRSNYERYAQLSGVDIINNPSILNTDINASATVSVAYFKDRLSKNKVPQNDARFFEAAVKAVGYNTQDVHAKKQAYYEYFLGAELALDSKVATSEDIAVTPSATATKTTKPGGSRISNAVLGFSDPEGKYPLRTHLHEPDTNRLARGQIIGTCVEKKDTQRTPFVPTAFGGSFEQPIPPFAAAYPYNKVYETESGSVMEFDDTPQNERINIFHRSGTFTEIDANGTQVNKIVGDGYTIIERNGCVYITGECNLTVDGNINILCNSTANIEVMGDANVDVRSDANIGVFRDVKLGVGRNLSTFVGGNMTTKVKGDYNLVVDGDYRVSATTSSIVSSSYTALQGAEVHLNTAGKAKIASVPESTSSAHVPATGEVKDATFEYLETPPRGIADDLARGETPDDFDNVATANMNASIIGTKSTAANTPIEESQKTAANSIDGVVSSCDLIMNNDEFQSSYVLSETSNITIGTFLECPGNSSVPQDTLVLSSTGGESYRITKQEVVCNMKQVAVNILENIYEPAGGRDNIVVLSSFRVNNSASDHDTGSAIDIQLRGKSYDYRAHYELICKLQIILPYDQLILQYRDATAGQKIDRKVWIHISYRGKENRKMAFTMLNDVAYMRDNNNQPSGFYLL